MKRIAEADNNYPDFTALYLSLNTTFYERVVSHIPKEVWANVFHYLFREETMKYSHYWTTLTLVSKFFYTTVYEEIKDIYLDVNNFIGMGISPATVLGQFQKIETLRLPCFIGHLTLPKMSFLKKLKIRYPKKNRCKPYGMGGGVCNRDSPLGLLESKNLPLLTALSYRNCCLTEVHLPPPDMLAKLTKITHNIDNFFINEPDRVPSLTELNIIKCKSVATNITIHKNLKKIHVNGKFTGFGNYTGECVIYYHKYYSKTGQMVDGKKVGLWKGYNDRKRVVDTKFYEKEEVGG